MRAFFARALPFAERVGSTYLQTFAAAFALSAALNIGAASAAAIAAVPAVLSLLYNGVTAWLGKDPLNGGTYWRDLLERAAATAAQTFLGGLVAQTHYSLSELEILALAGVAAALSVLKSGVATLAGSGNASLAGLVVVDHSKMRLGRLPAIRDPRTLRLARYLNQASLPVPPDATTRAAQAKLRFPMYLNDKLGDCTCAAIAHMVQLWDALSGRVPPKITNAEVLTVYEAVSGYDPSTGENDNGAVELDVLKYWRKIGIAGHRIVAFVAVNVKNLFELKTAAWLFDGLYLGVALPITAQTQKVWDVVPNAGRDGAAGSWGGHAVNIVDYDTTGVTIVTWGQLKRVTWAFVAAYVDEAYAALSTDAINGATNLTAEGFDDAQLLRDLAAVSS